MLRLLPTAHALTFLLALLVAAPAHGQIIYVDDDAAGANDGSSWADAYTDLQTAINNASGSEEIWVAEGVYVPGSSEGDSFSFTGAKDGLEIYGGFEGTESSRDQRDPGAHPTVLSGDVGGDDLDPDGDGVIEDASDINGGNSFHVLFLDGTTGGTITTSTVIDGVTITGGQADGGDFRENFGGGILCDGANGGECSPSLQNVVFAGNSADFGGAIYNRGHASVSPGVASPQIVNAVFSGNSAGDGGAIYNDGDGSIGENPEASPTIVGTTFSNNSASTDGGAIYNTGTANPAIMNTILWGNQAGSSGDQVFNNNGATPVFSHSIVEGSGGSSNWSGPGTDNGGNLDQNPQFLDSTEPQGSDGTFASRDDGLNVIAGSPAMEAGDNGAVPSGVTEDITDGDRVQDNDGDGTATVNIGAYEPKAVTTPTTSTSSIQNVTASTAEVSGTVNPGGLETTVRAEVFPVSNPSGVQTVTASASPLPAGNTDQNVSVALSGLIPNTEYKGRVLARNSEGTGGGLDLTFMTGAGYARRIKGTDGPGNDAGWRMLALPAQGKTRAALEDNLEFNVGAGSILYRWLSGSWTAQTNSSDNLPRARGFMLYFFDDPFETIGSGGIPLGVAAGSEDQSLDKTVGSLSTSETFHLLGNPFDTAFDLSALNLSSQGFQTTVQIWDPSAGSYTTVTQASDDSDVIGAWQGFFVERDPNASTDGTELTFSTSGKQSSGGGLIGNTSWSLLAGSEAAGQKAPSKRAETKRAKLELRLTVTGEASSEDGEPPSPANQTANGSLAENLPVPPTRDSSSAASGDQPTPKVKAELDMLASGRATVLFAEAATGGWDAYEASQLTPFSSGGYATLSSPLLRPSSETSDSTLVRRALASEPYPTDTSAIRLPVSVRSVGTTGEATIAWPEDSRDRLPEEWTVELIDTEAGKRVDLRAEPYSFELADGDGEVSSPSESRFRLVVGPASAIPVELAGFEAQAVAEESVRLTWKTTSEQDNAGFAVQRKGERERGGQGVWMKVGFVKGAGTTSEPQNYRFTDSDLPYAADTLSYRLKQVDLDGTAHFTDEVVVERAGAREVVLKAPFPNPVRSRATVRYALPNAQEVRLVVYDVLGRRVRTLVNERQEAGRTQVRLDASRLSSGTYLLRLTAGGAQKTRKLTVVR